MAKTIGLPAALLLGALLLAAHTAGGAPPAPVQTPTATPAPSATPTVTPAPPDTCSDWVVYAGCDEGSGNCLNNALYLGNSSIHTNGGGVHSNSGLFVLGSELLMDPVRAEWGTPGFCRAWSPAGVAVQVPRAIAVLYRWKIFNRAATGGTRCARASTPRCHMRSGINSSETISGGLRW
jgi:hypothetical protein